jgi:hypothetical protein
MSRVDLKSMTVEELVNRFARLGIEQDQAQLHSNIRRVNRLFDEIEVIKAELKARGDDARNALQALHTHPNMQVRLKAAIATLGVARSSARKVLEDIIDAKEYPQTANASGILSALDEGSYVPD